MAKLNFSRWRLLASGVLREVGGPIVMLVMATLAECFEVFIAVVVSVFVLMMNFGKSGRTATLASWFLLSSISFNASGPSRITLLRMIVLSAYCRVVALPGAVAANIKAMLWNGVLLPAMLACKRKLIFVPSSSLFTISPVPAFYGAEHSLATSKWLTASAIHLPIVAAKAYA